MVLQNLNITRSPGHQNLKRPLQQTQRTEENTSQDLTLCIQSNPLPLQLHTVRNTAHCSMKKGSFNAPKQLKLHIFPLPLVKNGTAQTNTQGGHSSYSCSIKLTIFANRFSLQFLFSY